MEQEDANWIQENIDSNPPEEVPNMETTKSVYKYQWSVKKDNGEIIVVTADTQNELVLNMEWAKKLMDDATTKPPVAQPAPQFAPSTSPVAGYNPNATKYTCNICGGPMNFIDAISKAGKPYKMLKCVAFPELVQNKKGVVGHSRFL